jgi:hypothetical protein
MAHDVFISYSTKDKIIADAVCAKLEESKIRSWIAPRDVPAGANFGKSIINAINNCKVFILIWSADTHTSNHIMNEINQAFNKGITIIPFRIQDVQPNDEMSYYLGRTHWLDAIDPPLEKHIAVLRDTVLANLGREPYQAESPHQPEKPKVEKEVASGRVEIVKPKVDSPLRKKPGKIKKSDQSKGAFMTRFGKFIPFALIGVAVAVILGLYFSGGLDIFGSDISSVAALTHLMYLMTFQQEI